MNGELQPEAIEFGTVVRRALEDAGGDRIASEATSTPDWRSHRVDELLGSLGAWDLDPRSTAVDLEAAAALCRSVGYWGVPYPVAERLSRPIDLDVDGLIAVNASAPVGAVAGLQTRWTAVDLEGHRSRVTAIHELGNSRHTSFVAGLQLEPLDAYGAQDLLYALLLPTWTLLGMLDRAIELTCNYAKERSQFGQHLAAFQGVQFQLTDAEVERAGVEVLAKYALWSVGERRGDALADVLAARLCALEAAEVVFRVTHQIHGAIGFCDETTLSWLSRFSQPIRRFPYGLAETRALLTREIGSRGLSGLFDEVTL